MSLVLFSCILRREQFTWWSTETAWFAVWNFVVSHNHARICVWHIQTVHDEFAFVVDPLHIDVAFHLDIVFVHLNWKKHWWMCSYKINCTFVIDNYYDYPWMHHSWSFLNEDGRFHFESSPFRPLEAIQMEVHQISSRKRYNLLVVCEYVPLYADEV